MKTEKFHIRVIDSKDQNFFKTGIYALKSRWEKCIETNGAY